MFGWGKPSSFIFSSHLKLNINLFDRNWKVLLQSLFLSNKLMFNFKWEEKIKLDDYEKVKQYYKLEKEDGFPQSNT